MSNLAVMSESQTRIEQRPSASKPEATPAVVGEPGITERKAPGGMPWESDHPVNIRLSIPLLNRRCYVTLVVGMERRSRERLAEERLKNPLAKTGNVLVIAAFGLITGLALLAVFHLASAYRLKQAGVLVGAQ